MSFDLFMNDTCPKCRRPIKLAVIETHAINSDLAVHKFKCSNCGLTTKTLLRKESKVSSNLAA